MLALNRYQIGAQIGKGLWGVVCEGTDVYSQARVAVKSMSLQILADPLYNTMFQNEISNLGMLNHTNIVKLLNHGQGNNSVFIIYELCDNIDLREKLKSKGRFNEKEALQYMIGILEGINHSHNMGVLHRDIKPENIFFKGENPKIGDWGFCVRSFRHQEDNLVGTMAYQAPETITHKIYSQKTDVYSLGIMFYELLNGKIPFTANDVDNIAQVKQNLRLDNLQNVSNNTMDLIRAMCEPHEQTRIPSSQALTRAKHILSNPQRPDSFSKPFLQLSLSTANHSLNRANPTSHNVPTSHTPSPHPFMGGSTSQFSFSPLASPQYLTPQPYISYLSTSQLSASPSPFGQSSYTSNPYLQQSPQAMLSPSGRFVLSPYGPPPNAPPQFSPPYFQM